MRCDCPPGDYSPLDDDAFQACVASASAAEAGRLMSVYQRCASQHRPACQVRATTQGRVAILASRIVRSEFDLEMVR